MTDLPFRQLHLDFHTSPFVAGVGEAFDEGQFVADLQRARVQSVTCFSRCHHGYIYHPTRFEDLHHPGLETDLLGRQLAACHKAGIRAPVYITVGWDDIQARRHPEWLERDTAGRAKGPGPLEPGFSRKLCLHGPYVDFLHEQTAEVLERYPCDGFFFDIVHQGPCLCPRCLASMTRLGLDPEDPAQRQQHADGVLDGFKRAMTRLVREHSPEASVFYNSGHVGPETRRVADALTHLEIESLPGGQWGHLHFPITARFARGLGLPRVGMTAVFHGSWGDFCAPKSPPALEQECFQMLAHGVRCSVGDQLHPDGRFNPDTVALLAGVYEGVERREPWCAGAEPCPEVGVLHPEAFGAQTGLVDRSAAGAVQILEQGHHQLDFIDGMADFSSYQVLVIPDLIRVDDHLARSLGEYLRDGGALLLAHVAGMAPGEDRFTLPEVGATGLGPSPHEPDFLVPGPQLAGAVRGRELVMKWRAMRVRPLPDTEVLARVRLPQFNRTWRHYHSHQHGPPCGEADYPAVIQRKRVIYLAHPVFSMYRQRGWPWCRELVLATLARLLPRPMVVSDAPRSCQVLVTRQADPRRTVVHLLHYLPRAVAEDRSHVDEVIPLHDVGLALRQDEAPRRVYTAPGEQELSFRLEDGYVRTTVPRVDGHLMVVFE